MRYISERVEASRNFANKLWNAGRFILMNLNSESAPQLKLSDLALEDKWILSQYNAVVSSVTENLEKYELGLAVQKLYDFTWDVFCDWYIEISKARLTGIDSAAADTARAVLVYVYTGILSLLHPFMPFITEEIWQSMPHNGKALVVAPWPRFRADLDFSAEESEFEKIMAVIKAVRNRRAEMGVPVSKKAKVCIVSSSPETFRAGAAYICRLASASEVEVGDSFQSEGAVRIVTDAATVFIPMRELVDAEKELARLHKELENAEKDKEFIEKKLSNAGFVAKAPAAVVEQQRENLSKVLAKIDLLGKSIAETEKLM